MGKARYNRVCKSPFLDWNNVGMTILQLFVCWGIAKLVSDSPLKLFYSVVQGGNVFFCVMLTLICFTIYWITSDVYREVGQNVFFFGFFASGILNAIAFYSFAPLKLHGSWGMEISIKFLVAARLTEIGTFLFAFICKKQDFISKKFSVATTLFYVAAVALGLSLMPSVFTDGDKMTALYRMLYLMMFLLHALVLLLIYRRKVMISTDFQNDLIRGILFGLFSCLCFALSGNSKSILMLWGSIQRYLQYAYFFKSFLKVFIIYPFKHLSNIHVETEERYKSSFDHLSIGVALTDLNGAIIKANKPLLLILGYEEKELLKRSFDNIIPDGDAYVNKDSIDRLLVKDLNETISFETRYIHKNGQSVWVRVNISRADDLMGKPKYFIYELQDITTNRKVIELELGMQQKKLQLMETQELDKIKTEFIANLSHELRTPLNVITGAVQLLEINLSEYMNDRIRRNLDYIRQNSRRLLRLVNNLIDTTKLEAGFRNLNLRNFDIVSLVEDIALSITDYTDLNGLELLFDTNVEEKIIACDPDKIERIVLNLLSNAIKFTDRGGSIFVTLEISDDQVILSIRDNGIGISEDQQAIIFDRFRQVERSFTKTREGSGIGLSLVKALVEQHGGKIRVISEPGIGSEFIITLPAYTIEQEAGDSASVGFYADRIERVKVEFSDIYIKEDGERTDS